MPRAGWLIWTERGPVAHAIYKATKTRARAVPFEFSPKS
jgi:hypothetical protein